MVLPPVTVMKHPSSSQKTVLITGCSQGSLGDALAQAFHAIGYRVFATARNPSKITHFKALGIETLPLDVLSAESIAACVSSVETITGGSLDMLINNSGAGYSMPLVDVDLAEARKTFELNVFAVLAVTQAFVPLLLKSQHGAKVVNNTSIASRTSLPLSGIYNASKAAAAMLTDNLRLELAPFNIKVVELVTGAVKSNFNNNLATEEGDKPTLPKNSIYGPARAEVEKAMTNENLASNVTAKEWAEKVVRDLNCPTPRAQIWSGQSATLVWILKTFFSHTFPDSILAKKSAMNTVAEKVEGGQGKGHSFIATIIAKVVGV